MKGLPFFGLPLWVLCLLNIKEDSLYFSKIVFYEQLLWRSLSIIWVYLLIPAIKDNNTQNCWQALIIIYIYDLLNEYDYFLNRGPFFKLTRAKEKSGSKSLSTLFHFYGSIFNEIFKCSPPEKQCSCFSLPIFLR